MPNTNESQCYFVQLQFDTYLDGELSKLQKQEFQAHVQRCSECAREFQFAQRLYDAVLDLPLLDCNDQVLEPIHRLGVGEQRSGSDVEHSWWQQTLLLLDSMPPAIRYAIPALLLLVLVLPVIFSSQQPQTNMPLVAEQTQVELAPQFSPAEIQQALADLNLAIQYLNEVSERTEVLIEERFLLGPLQESLDASFEIIRRRNNDPLQNDPI